MDSDEEKKRRETTEETVKGCNIVLPPRIIASVANGETIRKLFNPSEVICKNGAIFYIKMLEEKCGK